MNRVIESAGSGSASREAAGSEAAGLESAGPESAGPESADSQSAGSHPGGSAPDVYLAPVTYLFGPRTNRPTDHVDQVDHVNHPDLLSDGHAAQPADGSNAGDGAAGRPAPLASSRGKASFDPVNNVSMYALARRGMSSREMRDYLASRDFAEDEIDGELDRLERVGLLDDRLLAETLIDSLRHRKGLGRSGVTAELGRRKLDPIAIEAALASVSDDEGERALEVAVKRAPQLRSLDAETARRRLSAYLMRKGYSGSVVSTAVSAALASRDRLERPSRGPVFR